MWMSKLCYLINEKISLYSVQGVALRYVDYALTGRFHSAW